MFTPLSLIKIKPLFEVVLTGCISIFDDTLYYFVPKSSAVYYPLFIRRKPPLCIGALSKLSTVDPVLEGMPFYIKLLVPLEIKLLTFWTEVERMWLSKGLCFI
jgi:hypothetical protein